MTAADVLVRGTIWLSMAAWATAEWWRLGGSASKGDAARRTWALGAGLALLHAAAAFHFRHAWSQSAALDETARRTQVLFGVDSGAGLYVNYAFLAVWMANAAWWWAAPEGFRSRPPAGDRFVRLFLAFMFLNGAVVFTHGAARALGALILLAVAIAWYRGRASRKDPA
jgi:hypothetical protein